MIFLFGEIGKVRAQTMGSPDIRCVAVDSAGDVTLTWLDPIYNSIWTSYEIFCCASPSYIGTITTYTITNPSTQTSLTIPVGSLPASPKSAPLYFYMITTTTTVNSPAIDTVSTMYLSVTNVSHGVAQLQWNSVRTPFIPQSSHWYKIYREFDYKWTLLDSVESSSSNMVYYDTTHFCNSTTLHYQVTIADSIGCESSSNWGDANSFTDYFAPPACVLDSVSVNSANQAVITWSKSPKGQTIGYVLYIFNYHGNGWQPYSLLPKGYTVAGINTTSLILPDTAGNPSDSSLNFEVAAIDSCGILGVFNNPQHTLFLKQKPNICAESNTLTWGRYVDLYPAIGGYRLYVSINGGPDSLLATTDVNTTFYVDSNLTNPSQFRCYFVQVYDSSRHDTTASSNRICYHVEAPTKPKYNYERYATVIDYSSQIKLLAHVDTSSSAGYYQLQRAGDTGKYAAIATIPAPHHTDTILYTDNTANPNVQSFRYQFISQDSCYQNMDTSNIGQTMFLTAFGQPTGMNLLTWNDYNNWQLGANHYSIFRSVDGISYTDIYDMPYGASVGGINSYNDNIKNVTQGQGTFYYYILAQENGSNVFGYSDTSISNTAKAYQDPTVYIPDAFNPKGVNQVFKPIGVFIDVQGYDFVILNRWGVVLFESNDPSIGWNGNGSGGKEEEEGVYVYLLTYTSSKGEYFQRKGTVTLLK